MAELVPSKRHPNIDVKIAEYEREGRVYSTTVCDGCVHVSRCITEGAGIATTVKFQFTCGACGQTSTHAGMYDHEKTIKTGEIENLKCVCGQHLTFIGMDQRTEHKTPSAATMIWIVYDMSREAASSIIAVFSNRERAAAWVDMNYICRGDNFAILGREINKIPH